MKKVLITILAAFVAISMQSCEDGKFLDDAHIKTIKTITASSAEEYRDAATRTVIDLDNAFDIQWMTGDAINVFFGASESSKFVTQTSGDVAQFNGSIDVVIGGGEGLDDDTSLWGVYPYNSQTTCDGSYLTYTLPAVQEAKAGSFADDLFPQIARSQNFYLSFYNVCGSFRFRLSNPDIVKVTLKGNNGEPIAGKAKISMETLPVVEEVLDGYNELIMYAPETGCFETDTWYLFVLYPTEFKNGVTITFHKNGSMASYVYSDQYTLKRNKFSYFDKSDKDLLFVEVEDVLTEGNIVFADDVMKELCVNAFDTNGDSELSYTEAAAVTDLSQMTLTKKSFKTFDEFKYFTGVTEIPADYFKDIAIKSITFPDGLKKIGDYAFCNCSSLTNIIVSESVTDIGKSAFSGCTSLLGFTIPDSVTSIGSNAFYKCSKFIGELIIPDSVKSIGTSVFAYCSGISNVKLPESLQSIPFNMFYSCTSLERVDIPKSVSTIDIGAFENCSSLSAVSIPNSVTSIGSRAFQNCSSLSCVAIPESLTYIGSSVFKGCTHLSTVVIPDAMTSITDSFFEGCSNLSNITIPQSVTSIGTSAFDGCSNLPNNIIPESVVSIGFAAFQGCLNFTSVTIPESVTTLGGAAFRDCTNLTKVVIPESVTKIDWYTFEGCTSLVTVVIPESVTSIGAEAFNGCTSLSTVTVPESVSSIANKAFYNCSSLSEVYLRASLPPTIGTDAFKNNSVGRLFYVPNDSVSAYSTASGWSTYANYIVGYTL